MALFYISCLLTRPVLAVEYLKASISHTEHTCSGYRNILTRRAKAMSVICVPSMSRIVASFSMLCMMADGHSVLHNPFCLNLDSTGPSEYSSTCDNGQWGKAGVTSQLLMQTVNRRRAKLDAAFRKNTDQQPSTYHTQKCQHKVS